MRIDETPGREYNGQSFQFGIYTIGNCPLHQHSDLELLWVISGELMFDTIYDRMQLRKGDFLLIDRNDFHRFSGELNNNEVIIAHIPTDVIEKICNNRFPYFFCYWYDRFRNNEEKINFVKHYLLQIITKSEKHQSPDISEINTLTENLISLFLNHFNLLYYFNSESEISRLQESRILEIMNYIRHNHQEKIKLTDISKTENIESTYLSHLLKDVSSCTFKEHLEFFRTEAALNMCIKTDFSIQRIALDCGFSDIKYLYKGFRKWIRKTPGEIKKQYKLDATESSISEELNTSRLSQILKQLEIEDKTSIKKILLSEKAGMERYKMSLKNDVLDMYYSGIPVNHIMRLNELPKATVYSWIKKSKEDADFNEKAYLRLLEENLKLKTEIRDLNKKLSYKE